MDIKTVNRHEFEQSPGSFLDFVAKGNEVLIMENDAARVRLTAEIAPARIPRQPDRHAGEIWMADDFDAPLPDSFWLGEDK